ncbi:MAG: membrane protein insertase YidC [Tannerella sp.]|jgi:YidC/Oxa1 family membrane protein insertase|nr:membrane protein insertase YidC [Tannerella sp.]
MDRNTVIGLLLIGLVFFLFTWLNRPNPEQLEEQRRYYEQLDSIAKVEQARAATISSSADSLARHDSIDQSTDSIQTDLLTRNFGVFAQAAVGQEETITLENEKVELKFNTKGGRLSYARLKDYVTYDGKPLILFDGEEESSISFTFVTTTNRVINTADLYFQPVTDGLPDNSVKLRLSIEEGRYVDFVYTLKPDDYMLGWDIQGVGLNGILAPNTTSLDMNWHQKARKLEQGRKFENQFTGLYYKYLAGNVEKLNENKTDEKQLPNRLKWITFKNKYFSTVLISNSSFESTRLQSTQLNETDTVFLKDFLVTTAVPFNITGDEPVGFTYFIGPNQYQLLQSYDNDVPSDQQLVLDELVPLGYKLFRPINKYFILPIFHFLGQHFTNYGIIILLLTLIVKIILFPLTYKSYKSSAKMRVLRPQVEEITAKFPKQDQAMDRQRATMDLYSRAGASPMAGCLPMLLQMPILFALYWLFPTSIELRQESFLWAKDLSTYDAVISWNFNIPFISQFLGNHLSLFCILMTITNIVYSKFNMDATNTGQQQMPGMKMMMYIFPVMMLFFFNQSASGLSYYFFISTLITVLQTLAFRLFVNEEKLLLQLEENKKKPKKKSGFLQRLEEAQRMQQQQQRKQQQQRDHRQQQERDKRLNPKK